MTSQLRILSPLSGQIWPLERVPDPVVAQKLVGDGLSIDPTDAVLLAGCDGEVVALPSTGHAVTIRTAEGIEVLMHVGIDTVTMKGEGFQPRVKPGDRVRAGDPLIAFDLDFLATHSELARAGSGAAHDLPLTSPLAKLRPTPPRHMGGEGSASLASIVCFAPLRGADISQGRSKLASFVTKLALGDV